VPEHKTRGPHGTPRLFSPLLYQLSYQALREETVWSFKERDAQRLLARHVFFMPPITACVVAGRLHDASLVVPFRLGHSATNAWCRPSCSASFGLGK